MKHFFMALSLRTLMILSLTITNVSIRYGQWRDMDKLHNFLGDRGAIYGGWHMLSVDYLVHFLLLRPCFTTSC